MYRNTISVLIIIIIVIGLNVLFQKHPVNYNLPVDFNVLDSKEPTNIIDLSKKKEKPVTMQEFLALVKSLPDGAFKSNILFVVAADYNGDSMKLNEILQAYGELLKAQLHKSKMN